jgi:hypothetical protein
MAAQIRVVDVHDPVGLEGYARQAYLAPAVRGLEAVAAFLDEMLRARDARERWGAAAQRRVYEEFLVFTQVRRWLEVLSGVVERPGRIPSRSAV